MKKLLLPVLAASLAAAAVPALAGDCDTTGKIVSVETQPPGFQIEAEGAAADEEAVSHYSVDERYVPGWKTFKVGDRVQATCHSNPEVEGGKMITAMQKLRPRR